jgi:CubicO group peptidase (beta-lactamase class C family)
MERKVFQALGLLVLAGVASIAGAQSARPEWKHAKLAETAMSAHLKAHGVPGLGVAIYAKGRLVFAGGAGFANIANRVKAGPDTFFRLGSVSKPLSSLVAMWLVEQGKLDLDNPIRTYLPEAPAHQTGSLTQILAHTSGIRHYRPTDDFGDRPVESARKACELFWNDPLLAQPGIRYSYSTHAYSVLAAAMETVSGLPFKSLIKDRFAAWGFPKVRPERHDADPARSQVYVGPLESATRDHLDWKTAGGGYESTARELALLGSALPQGEIIRKENLSKLWTEQRADGKGTQYGLGWRLATENGRRTVSHSGGQVGCSAYWLIYPDERICIAVLTNRSGNPAGRLANYLSGLALGLKTAIETPYQPVAPRRR